MKKRAFTLIEVVVALSLGVVVIAAMALMMTQTLVGARRQHILGEMQRDGLFASELMGQEIRQAGLGVPAGAFVMSDGPGAFIYGTGSAGTGNRLQFGSRHLIVALGNKLGFVGDLPRPDSNYSAFGALDDRPAGFLTGVAFHTENNGTCLPPNCNTNDTSVFFPVGSQACTNGTFKLDCPWASRRILNGERILIAAGDGTWGVAAVTGTSPQQSGANALSLPIDSIDRGTAPTWKNTAAGDGPGGIYGAGWVATIDRVFYKLNGTTLQRTQCTGNPDPNNTSWPNDGNNDVPGVLTTSAALAGSMVSPATVCIVQNETIARNVSAIAFRYAKADGTVVSTTTGSSQATLETIVSVQWTITMTVNDAQVGAVSYQIDGGAALSN